MLRLMAVYGLEHSRMELYISMEHHGQHTLQMMGLLPIMLSPFSLHQMVPCGLAQVTELHITRADPVCVKNYLSAD